jgi:hypothetical protein
MIKDDQPFPPPTDWIPIEISWDVMLANPGMCHAVVDWCLAHPSGGHFQLRGSDPVPTDGFRFYFQLPQDAEIFALKWS